MFALLKFHKKEMDLEEFEKNKERIFGEEVIGLHLDDKLFKKYFSTKKN